VTCGGLVRKSGGGLALAGNRGQTGGLGGTGGQLVAWEEQGADWWPGRNRGLTGGLGGTGG